MFRYLQQGIIFIINLLCLVSPISAKELKPSQLTGKNYQALQAKAQAAGIVFRSAQEVAQLQQSLLAHIPAQQDLWIFGYGSIMWNPTLTATDALIFTNTTLF